MVENCHAYLSFLRCPLFNKGFKITELLVDLKLCLSKTEAKNLIKQGGISIFDKKVLDENFILYDNHFIDIEDNEFDENWFKALLIKRGKKQIKWLVLHPIINIVEINVPEEWNCLNASKEEIENLITKSAPVTPKSYNPDICWDKIMKLYQKNST